jgi:signal peptidase
MLTGSMSPNYPVGSVLVVREQPVERLRTGQVITYQIPVDDHRVVSHRVLDVKRGDDGAYIVKTKGDANNGPDPWVARIDDEKVWTVRGVVPYAGHALLRLRTPSYRPFLLYGVPAALVLWTLAGIWRAPR